MLTNANNSSENIQLPYHPQRIYSMITKKRGYIT